MSSKDKGFDAMVGGAADAGDEETALAVQDSSIGREYSDTPEFDKSDVSYPRLRLAQGLTQEVQDGLARPGDYVLMGYEPEKSVVLVPLLAAKLHERKDEESGFPVACPNHGPGAVCPDTNWTPNPRDPKKNIPPVCGVGYSYVAFSLTHDCLVSTDFRKSATTMAKAINTMIAGRGLGNFAITLSAKSNTGPRGTYSTPAVVPTKVSDDDLARARAAL